MPLFSGTKEIDQVFIGNKEIQQIYNGTKEIWSNNKIVKLQYGGSEWDIKSIYSKYGQLTENNFFYLKMDNAVNCSDSVTVSADGDTQYINILGYLNKTYNPSTGKFNSLHYLSGSGTVVGAVTPVLVTDTSKITYVGTGAVNISARFPNYKSLTEDNFIVAVNARSGYMWRHSRSYTGHWSVQASHFFTKTYNPETGDVVANFYFVADANVDSDDVMEYASLPIYYVSKAL